MTNQSTPAGSHGFSSPTTIDEAMELKRSLGDGARFLAGGTDLGVLARRGTVVPSHLIHLGAIPGLRRIERATGILRIGAMTTHRDIERAGLGETPLAALAEACRTVGSRQTRNAGTLGGNVCNASPAADTPPALVALGAEAVVAGPGGHRRVPMGSFFTAYRTTVLADDEVLTAIEVPLRDGPAGSAFEKLGRRSEMEISIVCVAANVRLAADGTVAACAVALGSVAPTVVEAPSTAASLVGRSPDPRTIEEAATLVTEHLSPIDDLRSSAEYRRRVAPVLTARALSRAIDRARRATT